MSEYDLYLVVGHFQDGERFWSKWRTYSLAREEMDSLSANDPLSVWCIVRTEGAKDLANFF